MGDVDKKKSFWETLPGIITAIGGLLTGLGGVAAVIGALHGTEEMEKIKTKLEAAKAELARLKVVDAEKINKAKLETEAAKAAFEQEKLKTAELEKKLSESEKRIEVLENTAQQPKEKSKEEIKVTKTEAKENMMDGATGMEFVYVPKGCVVMGSLPDEKDRRDDESPAHTICVDSFYMAKYEVTQWQWQKLMGENPSEFKSDDNSHYPVENVSWNDAQNFIKKLNDKTSKNYRLPTEAEWEYACRGNDSSVYKNYKFCGSDALDAIAWYGGNSDGPQKVGGKQANAFGLHDMSGNVLEWCADWYKISYYISSPKNNPQGPPSGQYRVLRGGSWISYPMDCRSAYRHHYLPEDTYEHVGFRLVLPALSIATQDTAL